MLGRRRSRPQPPDAAVVARDIRTFLLWAAAITAVGLLPFLVFVVMLRSDLRLRDGVRADATVTEVLHVRKSSKGPPETSAVRVAFTSNAGLPVSAVLHTTRRNIEAGDPVRLTYDSTEPTRVRAVDGTEMAWRVPLIIAVTLWSLALICLYLAVMLRLGRLPRSYLKSRPAGRRV